MTIIRNVSPYLILFALAALLWLPFGFNIGFLGDEWFLFFQSTYTPIWGQVSRPLLALPNYAAYLLSPENFWGFNIMLALCVALRSILTFALLRRLRVGRLLAFSVGALTAAFPADQGLYYLGALQVYYSSVFYLLAVVLFLEFAKSRRAAHLLGMVIAQILCLGMYESSYPLILFTPVLLLFSRSRIDRNFWMLFLLWLTFPILNTLRLIIIYQTRPDAFAYQESLFLPSALNISELINTIFAIFERHFIKGWLSDLPLYESPFFFSGLLSAFIVSMTIIWLGREGHSHPKNVHLLLMIGGGAVVLLLSVAIFLPTSARLDHYRIYFTSVIGAALIICALLTILKQPYAFAAVIGLLVGVGTIRLLDQGQHFAARSQMQQNFILSMLALAPDIEPWTGIIIIDETETNALSDVFGGYWSMQNPFLLAYDDPTLVITTCPSLESGSNRMASCTFTSDRVIVESPPEPSWERPYNQVVIFRYNANRELSLISTLPAQVSYNPFALIPQDAAPARRILRMFGAD